MDNCPWIDLKCKVVETTLVFCQNLEHRNVYYMLGIYKYHHADALGRTLVDNFCVSWPR